MIDTAKHIDLLARCRALLNIERLDLTAAQCLPSVDSLARLDG